MQVTALEGFHTGQDFFQRYDRKDEYMVRSGGSGNEFSECLRSYLSEPMPVPKLPTQTATLAVGGDGVVVVDGFECEHWVEVRGDTRLHIYVRSMPVTAANGDVVVARLPYQLVDEYVDPELQVSEPVMTYTLHNFTAAPPPAEEFELPAPYTHKTCKRHIGGQPYFHLFSSFLRV